MSNPGRRGDASRSGVALGHVGVDGSIDLLGDEPILAAQSRGDHLAPAIARLFERAQIEATSLDRVAVSIGPGGFTGLRISVMTAKLIAEVAGAKCAAVPTADVVRRRVPASLADIEPIVVCLAWKREDAWCAEYEAGSMVPRLDPGLLTIEEVRARVLGGLLVADEPVVERVNVDRSPAQQARSFEPIFDPVALLEVSVGRACIDPVDLAPLYPRPPEAVRKWAERKG